MDEVLADGVIAKAAALAAKDKGSARQAIQYLARAGEIASNEGSETVTIEHVDRAEEEIERRAVERGIRDLTRQDTLTLLAVIVLEICDDAPGRTRAVYRRYSDLCDEFGIKSLAMRRAREHLLDLDMIGIVNAQQRQTGVRGGPHYLWELNTDIQTTLDVIEDTGGEYENISSIVENIAG
jgi:cell division control protein 6